MGCFFPITAPKSGGMNGSFFPQFLIISLLQWGRDDLWALHLPTLLSQVSWSHLSGKFHIIQKRRLETSPKGTTMGVFSWFHLTQQHFPVELGTLDFHQRTNQPQWCFCPLNSVFNSVDLSWNSLSELQLLKWIFMIFLRQMTWKWSLKKC